MAKVWIAYDGDDEYIGGQETHARGGGCGV